MTDPPAPDPPEGTPQAAAAPRTDRVGIFVAGGQKCGTTALHDYLAGHPDLRAPHSKEPHFFDNEAMDWARPDYDFYAGFFSRCAPGGRLFESTPITSFWPPAAFRLHAYNPDARLIVLFRDPIERAYSHWCMEYRLGTETLLFAQAIREGRDRLAGRKETHPDRRVFSYVERGLYHRQVARLDSLFPPEQLLFLRSRDLDTRPEATLARITDFLGLPAFAAVRPHRRHLREKRDYPSVPTDDDIACLTAIFRPDAEALAARTGLDISDWLTITGDRVGAAL